MPVHYEIEQNTEDWLNIRLGIPTASMFSKIITPVTMAPSKSADEYIYSLLAEHLLKQPLEHFKNEWTERGHLLEPDAARAYSFLSGNTTSPGGFWMNDALTYGASPDRLVEGEDGLLEIKCPAPKNHARFMDQRSIDAEHRCQLQGQLLVTGRQWVDIISFCPGLPNVIVRVERDEIFIAKLRTGLDVFSSKLDALKVQYAEEVALPQTN